MDTRLQQMLQQQSPPEFFGQAAPPPVEPEWQPPEDADELSFEEEMKLLDIPQWKYEGATNEDEYRDQYVRLVKSLLEESKLKWEPIKRGWYEAQKRIELRTATTLPLGKHKIPFIPQAVEEAVALVVQDVPRPSVSSKQASEKEFASTLNYFMAEECEANNYDLKLAKAFLKAKTCFMGVLKQTWDPDRTGPFNQPGRIVFTSVDTRFVWPDPYAKGHSGWDDYRYLIVNERYDVADVKNRWPHFVNKQGADTSAKDASVVKERVGDDYVIGQRERVWVMECWLKDERKEFVPMRHPKTHEIVTTGKGTILGKWQKKYPNGRLLIVAGDQLVVDQPNPYRHGHVPYTFIPSRVADEFFSYSDVDALGPIEDQMGRLLSDAFQNLRVNMNTPFVTDNHAFDSPEKFWQIIAEPGKVYPIRPGARFERLQAADLPQSFFMFMQVLRAAFDDLLGVQPVLRGQLEKGAQVAASTVEQLQVSGTARIRLRSMLVENALKEFAYQLHWNIRQFYPSKMEAEQIDPRTQEPVKLYWNADAAQADYAIESGTISGLPGAKEQGKELFIKLFEKGLIPREYAIRQIDLPGGEEAIKEMRERENQLAELGFAKELLKKQARPGRTQGMR